MTLQRLVVIALLLLTGGCNLMWKGDKAYFPAPSQQVLVTGFGVNDKVDVLASGVLPIVIARQITNTGQAAVPAGYIVTETVEQLVFSRTAGSAGWSSGPPATHLLFTCGQLGPALNPGQSVTIQFAFPGPLCTANPPPPAPPRTVLDCGMYKETLVVDAGGDVFERNEFDNEAKHFFFVPSSQPRLNLNVTLNPNNDPMVHIVPVRRVQIPAFNYVNTPTTVRTHTAVINSNPAGGGWIYNGITPVVGPLSGATGVLTPTPVVTVLPGTAASTTVNYDVTFDPMFLGPDITGSGLYYVENLDSKVTAISTDGCQIRQKSLLVQVLFEERP